MELCNLWFYQTSRVDLIKEIFLCHLLNVLKWQFCKSTVKYEIKSVQATQKAFELLNLRAFKFQHYIKIESFKVLEPRFDRGPQSVKATLPHAIMRSVLTTRPWPVRHKWTGTMCMVCIACLCQSIEFNNNIGTGCWVQVLAWSSIAQSVFQRAFSLLEIRFQRPRFKSCIRKRKRTCLLSIWKSLACARASKLITTNMYMHMYTYAVCHIYIYVCVCVCVCVHIYIWQTAYTEFKEKTAMLMNVK